MPAFSQSQFNQFEFSFLKYGAYDQALNTISDEGCKHLSKANWPNLTYLCLGTKTMIKGATKLMTKAANFFPKLIGPIYNHYIYVQ